MSKRSNLVVKNCTASDDLYVSYAEPDGTLVCSDCTQCTRSAPSISPGGSVTLPVPPRSPVYIGTKPGYASGVLEQVIAPSNAIVAVGDGCPLPTPPYKKTPNILVALFWLAIVALAVWLILRFV